ncbi:MAG TPA: hypothetical protein VFO38_02850 [Candidatus Saccharimonadales bacterium]|nr:hypothetical protein [Candidatus Saccharimonadales bacterium]
MPVIRVEYDNAVVSEANAQALCRAAQKAVADVPGIKEVFVYGNASHIKINVAPVEVWVEFSAHIIDTNEFSSAIRKNLADWKQQSEFPHPINLTIIPMQWKLELGI